VSSATFDRPVSAVGDMARSLEVTGSAVEAVAPPARYVR